MSKKILFTTTDLTKWWGVWRKISLLSKFFDKKWFSNFFAWYYLIWEKYKFYWKYFNRNEKLILNHFAALYKLFSRAYFFKKYTKKNNINTIFSFWEKANLPAILSKILFKNKAQIITQKTVDINYFSKFDNLFNYLYRFTDKIIVLSAKTRLDLIKKYWVKKEKIEVFKNPIDLDLIKKLKEEKLEEKYEEILNNWKFSFVNVWRLTNQKNHELLIESFLYFKEKYPELKNKIQLFIIWWWEKERFEELNKKIKNDSDIYLIWFQDNPFNFLDKSDCFVLSSRYEWLPNAVLDAMSVWLPIISVDCPTWPKEVLSSREKKFNNYSDFDSIKWIKKLEFWILVENFNKEILTKAMFDLLSNREELKKYSIKSLDRINDYSLEKVWERYLELIK